MARPAPETAETKEGRRRTRLSLSSFSLSEKRRKGGRFERSKRKGGKKLFDDERRGTRPMRPPPLFLFCFHRNWRKKKETKGETNCDQRLTPWSLLLSTPPLAASLLPTKVRAQSRERDKREKAANYSVERETLKPRLAGKALLPVLLACLFDSIFFAFSALCSVASAAAARRIGWSEANNGVEERKCASECA